MAAPARREDIENRLRDLSKVSPGIDPSNILEVVESVMASIAGDHAGLNHRLYADIEALADFINTAKAEIATIQPDKINTEYLPKASDELNAIVGATEQATNAIFEAVETIESLAGDLQPEVAEQMTDAVTRVYEACGFQDITGQRVTKIVDTLQQIEAKVQELLRAFGEDGEAGDPAVQPGQDAGGAATPASGDDLMSGPQLPGSAINQDEVDALLASFD